MRYRKYFLLKNLKRLLTYFFNFIGFYASKYNINLDVGYRFKIFLMFYRYTISISILIDFRL